MLKLPYKTAPGKPQTVTIGNSSIGEIDLPKLGDLSPNERQFVKQHHPIDLRKLAVGLAKDIAAKSGMKLLEVYEALTSGDAQKLSDYLEEFINFQDQMEEISRAKSVTLATAVIKMRVCPEWSLEDSGNPQAIHPSLLNEIADFARKEESGWDESPQSEVTEEDLGNSMTQKNPTGEKSTGESSDTGEQTSDLVAATSDSSQPGS